jgi:hypothetical protein
MKYPYALAQYPKSYLGYKVSPYKICIQFNNPLVKLRTLGNDRKQLPKLPDLKCYFPVTDEGKELEIIATGCLMPTIEDMQLDLISAYKEYYQAHKEYYKENYNKDFKDFLLRLHNDLTNLITHIKEDK